MTGTIKSVLKGKGYGFISREGQEKDTFFHFSELVGVTPDELNSGDTVSFEIVEKEGRTSATKVTRE
ncbi:MAG: cold shock domain-containing protein [bacterium]|nr:cold shock domain-containing protein [bacterium]